MSYPQDIEDFTIQQLLDEINERVARHSIGHCSYCKRMHGQKPACKFPRRHEGKDL